ncbi:MAG: pentapeptide repeat-containing protein [Raoultibacter sp.]
MKISKPNVPGELTAVDNVTTYIAEIMDDDRELTHLALEGDTQISADLAHLDLSGSTVKQCVFRDCDLEQASFEDVVFVGCDFSNSCLHLAYFNRCEFVSCKFLGTDLSETVLKYVVITESIFQYANFTKAKFECVLTRSTDFSQADISEASIKFLEPIDTRFTGVSFFMTNLRGIDFSGNEIGDITVSENMHEFRGCSMDMLQAAGVAQRLGIAIKS